jgi:MoaA/NifB/PqqE/SkfB family radical SAM enzyme
MNVSAPSAAIFTEKPPFPATLRIEPTTACNLKCVFCLNHKIPGKRRFIDIELVQRVLEESFALGSREVGFFLNGEPFLHPDLETMIQMGSVAGYPHIYITSNGVLATRGRVEKLVEAGLDSLQFSLNAATRETYAKIHGFDLFDTVSGNLRDALKIRDTLGSSRRFEVKVSFVYAGEEGEVAAAEKQWASIVDEFKPRKIKNREGALGRIDTGEPCLLPFSNIYINAYGLLTLCCHDFFNELAVADLRSTGIEEAWHNEIAVAFRRKFLRAKIEGTLCGRCYYGFHDSVHPLKLELAMNYEPPIPLKISPEFDAKIQGK